MKTILGDELCDIVPAITTSCLVIAGVITLIIKSI